MKTQKRYQDNLLLAIKLANLVQQYPEMRFSQLLAAYGFVKATGPVGDAGQEVWQNEFYTEPEEVLRRVVARTELS